MKEFPFDDTIFAIKQEAKSYAGLEGESYDSNSTPR